MPPSTRCGLVGRARRGPACGVEEFGGCCATNGTCPAMLHAHDRGCMQASRLEGHAWRVHSHARFHWSRGAAAFPLTDSDAPSSQHALLHHPRPHPTPLPRTPLPPL
jgi:hypothetical protein